MRAQVAPRIVCLLLAVCVCAVCCVLWLLLYCLIDRGNGSFAIAPINFVFVRSYSPSVVVERTKNGSGGRFTILNRTILLLDVVVVLLMLLMSSFAAAAAAAEIKKERRKKK